MANHKRRRPKHQRAGCSYKPWKDERGKNGRRGPPLPTLRAAQTDGEEIPTETLAPARVAAEYLAEHFPFDDYGWEQDEDRRYRDIPDVLPPGVTLDLVG